MSVFLRQHKTKNDVSLVLVEGKYDPSKQNTTQKVIQNLGSLEDLKKIYVDPISHFKKKAEEMTAKLNAQYSEEKKEKMPRENKIMNMGYFPLKRLFQEFDLKDTFTYLNYKKKFKCDLFKIFEFLVYSQVIHPGSKIKEYKKKSQFFEDFSFSDDQMYDSINYIGANKSLILEAIQLSLKKYFKLDTTTSYYDGTNVYFEIDRETDMIKRGAEKNHRHDPIIGLGLLMDKNGIPITYSTYPGNQSETLEMHKNVQNLKKKERIIGKTIIIADKGLNSGDNMKKAIDNGDGYIFGQKVRNADAETTEWVLDQNGYKLTVNENNEITYKQKSIVGDFLVQIISPLNQQKVKITMRQKRVVFWSRNYAEKARIEREKLYQKAISLINNPSEYRKSTIGEVAHYIKEIKYDSNGEIINTNLCLDYERKAKDELLDGYYMIVTSETQMPNHIIIDNYHGLWEIEESFSIIKGVLKIRPVFAKTINSIEAHFLISFFALLLLRIIQKNKILDVLSPDQIAAIEVANRRKRKHKINIKKAGETPMKQIVQFMRDFTVRKIGEKYFSSCYMDLIPLFEEKYNLTLDREIFEEKDIKKIFACDYSAQDKN